MKKNDLVEVTIESMGSAGEGIGKIDGYPLFVKDTFPGDRARVSLTKVKKTCWSRPQTGRSPAAPSTGAAAAVRFRDFPMKNSFYIKKKRCGRT